VGPLSPRYGAPSGCGWKVAASILTKQSRTADRGWSSSFGVGHGADNSSPFGALGFFARGLQSASGTHMCRSLASCNHSVQGQLTNQIGVFRHRSAALFKYANRIRGIRKLPDVSKTSEFEEGREALTKPREKRHLFFSSH
jgi:hypothetical protein